MQSSLPKALGNDLRRVVGDDWVLTEPDRLLAYESDGLTAYRMLPGAVVLPKDTDEVSRVLRLLSEAGVTVVPRGAGTGLSGGALAGADSVMIGTARMKRIIEVDPVNRLAWHRDTSNIVVLWNHDCVNLAPTDFELSGVLCRVGFVSE